MFLNFTERKLLAFAHDDNNMFWVARLEQVQLGISSKDNEQDFYYTEIEEERNFKGELNL